MSHPARIAKDAELSARGVRQLDEIVGVPPEVTGALLGANGSLEAQLEV